MNFSKKRAKTLKAVVLASGGLDSTVTAVMAKNEGFELYLLTILYGQRHHIEVARAREMVAWLGVVEHKVLSLDLGWLGGSALITRDSIPKNRLDAERQIGIPVTYVPGRNTIFLSLALAYAEVLDAVCIYFGANIRDYSGYPDCRPEFLSAFKEVAKLGTKVGVEGKGVEIRAPFLFMTKAEIIKKGAELGVPFHLTHSCYDPNEQGMACGQCDSCLIRMRGFEKAGIKDPIHYGM